MVRAYGTPEPSATAALILRLTLPLSGRQGAWEALLRVVGGLSTRGVCSKSPMPIANVHRASEQRQHSNSYCSPELGAAATFYKHIPAALSKLFLARHVWQYNT
jgi:hypothetical protein